MSKRTCKHVARQITVYGTTSPSPSCGPPTECSLSLNIQRVQRRFTKRFPGYITPTSNHLKLPSLELRCLYCDLVWCYEVVFGCDDIYCNEVVELSTVVHTTGRWHHYKRFTNTLTFAPGPPFY